MNKLYNFQIGSMVEYRSMNGTKCVGKLVGFFKIPNGMYEFFPEPRALIAFPCIITTNPKTNEPISAVMDYLPEPFDLAASEPSQKNINIRAREMRNWDYSNDCSQWLTYAELFPVNIKQFLKL